MFRPHVGMPARVLGLRHTPTPPLPHFSFLQIRTWEPQAVRALLPTQVSQLLPALESRTACGRSFCVCLSTLSNQFLKSFKIKKKKAIQTREQNSKLDFCKQAQICLSDIRFRVEFGSSGTKQGEVDFLLRAGKQNLCVC